MLLYRSSLLVRSLKIQWTVARYPTLKMSDRVAYLGDEGLRMGLLYDLTRQWSEDLSDELFRVLWRDEEVLQVLFPVYIHYTVGVDDSEDALGSRFSSEGYKKVETREPKEETDLYD